MESFEPVLEACGMTKTPGESVTCEAKIADITPRQFAERVLESYGIIARALSAGLRQLVEQVETATAAFAIVGLFFMPTRTRRQRQARIMALCRYSKINPREAKSILRGVRTGANS